MLSIWLFPVEIKNAAAPFEFEIKRKVYYSAWVYVYPRCMKMSYSAKYNVRNPKCKYMCKYMCKNVGRFLVSATDVATELHPACC